MPKMTDPQLVALLSQAKEQAAIYNGEFMEENTKYLSAYLGEKEGEFAGIENQSSVVSTDIADVIEADMPSLMRIFYGSGDVVTFQSNTENPAEVQEAEEKTKYVNWVLRNQPESFMMWHSWLKDAEIQKNGVVKYFVDEQKEVDEVRFTGVDFDELSTIVESLNDPAVIKSEITSQEETSEGVWDLTFKVTRETKKICVLNIPPESFLISRNATGIDDAELVGDRVRKTRGELLAEGFKRDLIDQLSTVDEEENRNSNIKAVRNRDQGGNNPDGTINNWASQYVEITDLYVKIDFDGDGIAERRHVMISGNKILINEYFNHVPYASLSAILMPHKAIGRSRAEITYPTQLQKTALVRGMNDNIYMVNNPRNVVHPDVDLDDMLTVRTNGIIRMDDETTVLPQQAVFPLQIPYIGDRTLQVIQYVDQARAQTTGALLPNQGLDADKISSETATRFNGIKDSSDAKIELIARNYAETGVRKLYEGIAWLASRFQDTQTEIMVLGKQLTVNPTQWKSNHHIQTNVGLGAGNNEKSVESLQGLYQIQSLLKSQQSPLVDDKDIYNTLARITDGLGFPRTNEFFNNPEEPDELLRHENEQLNANGLQQQQIIEQLTEQIRQLQALSEVELIKAQAKGQADDKKAALGVAQLKEKAREFNIDATQTANKQQSDEALKITEMELNNNTDLPGGLDA
jgi:hypothetical protein